MGWQAYSKSMDGGCTACIKALQRCCQLQLVGAGGPGMLHKARALCCAKLCLLRQLCLHETAKGLWLLIFFK